MNGREVKGMCDGQGSPAGVTEALAMLGRALDHLNAADMASLPAIVQAGALRALGQAEAKHTAARARVLGAFAAQGASGKKTGPEDTRTRWQRRHDALEEACRRLIRAGMVPARAGQPTQLLVHLSLAQLRGTPGASPVEDAWAADRTTQPGWLTGPEADAALCDATIVPIVTGHVDWAALDQLTETFLLTHGVGSHACSGAGQPAGPGQRSAPVQSAKSSQRFAPIQPAEPSQLGDHAGPGGGSPSSAARDRLHHALLGLATDALSGPGGLAARLRAILEGKPLTSVSLPLDIGAATETIPAHLRRAATTRHPHCAFPDCDQPASVCDIHHIIPRSRGGPTSLPNLVPLCTFHHLTAIHRWGWALTLRSDGTTTATSPDGRRTLHSHGPPPAHSPPSNAA